MNREQDARLESQTGELFGALWSPYDEELFDQSVDLFRRRLELAGINPDFFAGKRCLDAGCGGGRNAIAMAQLGAASVLGVDLGAAGLADARQRAKGRGIEKVSFEQASILDLPLEELAFDVVWCAGVLMHTADPGRALDELLRVLVPGGTLYLLVYATGGLRWPLIQLLRPLAAQLGQHKIEEAVSLAALPANKRRTFVDDLFCPAVDFFTWKRLENMLRQRGCDRIERWGEAPRLDHEASLESYRQDLEALRQLWDTGVASSPLEQGLFQQGERLVGSVVRTIEAFEQAVQTNRLDHQEAMDRVIGQGHHRVWARKG